MPRRNTPYTEEELSPALRLLQDGTGYAEASRSTGIRRATLHQYLPGYGMPSQVSGSIGFALATLPIQLREKTYA